MSSRLELFFFHLRFEARSKAEQKLWSCTARSTGGRGEKVGVGGSVTYCGALRASGVETPEDQGSA